MAHHLTPKEISKDFNDAIASVALTYLRLRYRTRRMNNVEIDVFEGLKKQAQKHSLQKILDDPLTILRIILIGARDVPPNQIPVYAALAQKHTTSFRAEKRRGGILESKLPSVNIAFWANRLSSIYSNLRLAVAVSVDGDKGTIPILSMHLRDMPASLVVNVPFQRFLSANTAFYEIRLDGPCCFSHCFWKMPQMTLKVSGIPQQELYRFQWTVTCDETEIHHKFFELWTFISEKLLRNVYNPKKSRMSIYSSKPIRGMEHELPY
jgi:hypothetical protein